MIVWLSFNFIGKQESKRSILIFNSINWVQSNQMMMSCIYSGSQIFGTTGPYSMIAYQIIEHFDHRFPIKVRKHERNFVEFWSKNSTQTCKIAAGWKKSQVLETWAGKSI